jgi:hypothetical protein
MTKLAHLILIGGRPTPNVLTTRLLRPGLVVPIASYESQSEWPRLQKLLAAPGVTFTEKPFVADAFDLQALREACERALGLAPDAEWIGNVTCGTTLMSLVAYEALRDAGHTAWYLNTANRKVVVLAGREPAADECQQMFRLPFHLYAGIYKRDVKEQDGKHSPEPALLALARDLGQQPQLANEARNTLRSAKVDQLRDKDRREVVLTGIAPSLAAVLQQAATAGLALSCQIAGSQITLSLKGSSYWHFFDGNWLEMYVGDVARSIDLFDDVRVGVKIPADGVANNEIDLAAMAGTLLLLAECKSGKPKTEYLDTLRTLADMLGGHFVTRLYITSHIPEVPSEQWQSIMDQAAQRQVVVVHGGQLPKLADILRREVEHPTYSRR